MKATIEIDSETEFFVNVRDRTMRGAIIKAGSNWIVVRDEDGKKHKFPVRCARPMTTGELHFYHEKTKPSYEEEQEIRMRTIAVRASYLVSDSPNYRPDFRHDEAKTASL